VTGPNPAHVGPATEKTARAVRDLCQRVHFAPNALSIPITGKEPRALFACLTNITMTPSPFLSFTTLGPRRVGAHVSPVGHLPARLADDGYHRWIQATDHRWIGSRRLGTYLPTAMVEPELRPSGEAVPELRVQ
jgi:hypothetical protein